MHQGLEEPDAAEPARPDLWGARVSNDPGLPDHVTVWWSSAAITAWTPRRSGRRGRQRRYSDLAIETVLTLRLLAHLPRRQAEGFRHALFGRRRLDLSAPDETTRSRRRRRRVPNGEGLRLVLDSPGLSSVGAGEWAAAKHGGRRRRGWRKLSRRVDQSGVIRVHTLTEATGDEATTASIYSPRSMALSCASPLTLPLTRSPSTKRRGVRRSLSHRPARRPSLATPRGRPRGIGRSRWRRRSAGVAGSRRQGALVRAGWRTRASATRPSLAMAFAPGVQRGRGSEVVLGCEILNRMTEVGRPVSYRIGR